MFNFPPNKIVVPVDFSDRSFEAVDAALRLADSAEKVHVLHVLPDIQARSADVFWQDIDLNKYEQHATAQLRNRLNAPRYAGLEISVIFGDAGHKIADFANEQGAELIVIPSHGRTGLTRLLIGSVAERVVRLAHCPVLVLRE